MMAAMLPFAHLNLRRNPFGELAVRERALLAVVDIATADAALNAGAVVQVLGAHGRGKTTHLLALHARRRAAPFVRASVPQALELPPEGVAFVDEMDFVGPAARRALWRRAAGLAVATHVDLSAEIRGAGRTLETLELRGLTSTRLACIVDRRIEAARRGPGPVPYVPPASIESLRRACGDDVRAAERRLYDVFQDLQEVGDVAL
jgi:hypothetical protein